MTFAQEEVNLDIPVEETNETSVVTPAAQNQAIDSGLGIPSDSNEYSSYNSCVSGCSSCEMRCKDFSLQQYAENKMDVSVCDKLSNEQLNNFCKDNINSAIAVSSKDQSKCNVIKDEGVKTSCTLNIVQQQAVESGKTDACNTLPENSRPGCVNSVYFQLARKNNDESFCNKLSEEQKKECILFVKSMMAEAVSIGEPSTNITTPLKSKINLMMLLWVLGGIIILSGFGLGIYFLIKRKKSEEAPLLFNQQQQPSQLAQGMVQNQQVNQNQNIDLNRLQEALKKVGK